MQKSNHICYNICKHACFKLYNTYTNSMLKYRKKVVKKACNLQNRKKLKKVVDICEGWCYYNQVAAIRQRQKLKETLMNTGFFKN